MTKILIDDIIPIIVIMALGYVCGKLSYFDNDQRQGLNKLVLNIALPAALFISIVKATREMLAQDAVLTILGFIGIIVMFMLSYYLCRLMFHHSIQEAAVCALIAGSPTIGFLGFAVLDPIYGDTVSTNLVIAIISIVVNAVTIPIGMYLINLGQSKDRERLSKAAVTNSKGQVSIANPKDDIAVDPNKDAKTDKTAEVMISKSSNMGKKKNQNLEALINALKQPVCWAPLLAIVLVLIGVRVPSGFAPTFDLIAKANSGVAVLAAGLALSHCEVLAGLGDDLEHVLPLDSHPCGIPRRRPAAGHGQQCEQALHARHGCGPAACILRHHHLEPLQHLRQGRCVDHRGLHGCVRRHLPAVDLARAAVLPLIQPYIYI
jgi:malonate transporter